MTVSPPTERSLGDLVRDLSTQTSTLVRQELKLAQLEMQEKGKRAGIGAGLFGAAGIVALYGVGSLVAAAVLGLATVLAGWLSALIVAVVLFVAAGIAALVGRGQVAKATPALPQRAIDSSQRDVQTIKDRGASA